MFQISHDLDIQKFIKEEHKSLLDANEEPNNKQHPFEEEIHNPHFFVNN